MRIGDRVRVLETCSARSLRGITGLVTEVDDPEKFPGLEVEVLPDDSLLRSYMGDNTRTIPFGGEELEVI